MPPLIYVPPNVAKYPLTPDKYALLVGALKANPQANHLTVVENSGNVSFQGVDFSWVFDGSGELTVTILNKHSLAAKLVGNEAIFSRLNDQLLTLL